MTYAEINENNICFAISEMSDVEVSLPNLIPLETYDTKYLGMKYNNGIWEEVPQEEVIPEPTQLDRIEEQLNKNYAEAQQEAVDAYTLELMEGGII